MKIAIISDTHDNITNLKKALSLIKKEEIKTILHCGDVASLNTLKEVFKDFKGQVYIVLGNMDYISKEDNQKLPENIEILGEIGEVKIDKKNIAFCHFPEKAKSLLKTKKYDIVFYGHTHKPWEEEIDKIKLVNPGNLAGIICKATFAIYNTNNNLELKILEKCTP